MIEGLYMLQLNGDVNLSVLLVEPSITKYPHQYLSRPVIGYFYRLVTRHMIGSSVA